MTRVARLATTIAALGAAALASVAKPAAAATPEDRVKAAYLYKLASFVRWPDDALRSARFRYCLAGNKNVSAVLSDLVRGQRVAGAPIAVDIIDSAAPAQMRGCHVLFVARGRESARSMMGAADGQPILTVADRSGGTSGGVVDFVLRDGKVRFAIDRGKARRQGLELSSKLLDIAVAVGS